MQIRIFPLPCFSLSFSSCSSPSPFPFLFFSLFFFFSSFLSGPADTSPTLPRNDVTESRGLLMSPYLPGNKTEMQILPPTSLTANCSLPSSSNLVMLFAMSFGRLGTVGNDVFVPVIPAVVLSIVVIPAVVLSIVVMPDVVFKMGLTDSCPFTIPSPSLIFTPGISISLYPFILSVLYFMHRHFSRSSFMSFCPYLICKVKKLRSDVSEYQ